MPPASLTAAVRRFPLLGRPRPDCPALPLRIQEIADAVATARRNGDHGMTDAAHALNKAALIASDSGMTDLARHLCWQHIDTYRRAERPLTILEARHLLEPVLNLARLQIRTDQGTGAVGLLEQMYQAVTQRRDLTVDGRTLAIGNLAGEPSERRQLREWVWLQLIGEGIRALALADRWDDAADHARRYNGVGAHLMEGRQAVIIVACLHDHLTRGRAALEQSTPAQPWEHDVAACLRIMCTAAPGRRHASYLVAAVARYTAQAPAPAYASYRVRLGLTIATLAGGTRADLAADLLSHVTAAALACGDGYAARDVLGFKDSTETITDHQRRDLAAITAAAGIGVKTLPAAIVHTLTAAAAEAATTLTRALGRSS